MRVLGHISEEWTQREFATGVCEGGAHIKPSRKVLILFFLFLLISWYPTHLSICHSFLDIYYLPLYINYMITYNTWVFTKWLGIYCMGFTGAHPRGHRINPSSKHPDQNTLNKPLIKTPLIKTPWINPSSKHPDQNTLNKPLIKAPLIKTPWTKHLDQTPHQNTLNKPLIKTPWTNPSSKHPEQTPEQKTLNKPLIKTPTSNPSSKHPSSKHPHQRPHIKPLTTKTSHQIPCIITHVTTHVWTV
jgi:hypothetical protein